MHVIKLTFFLTLALLIRTCNADTACNKGSFLRIEKGENGTPISYCKQCTQICPAKKVKVRPCDYFHDIGCCPGENYDYSEGKDGILVCTEHPLICRKGQYWDTKESHCKPCPDGHVMPEDYHSYTKCWVCPSESETNRPLHTVVTQPCTRTQPFRYGCRENYTVNHGMSSGGDDIGCFPCQTCEKGRYVGRQCDMHHDTVCCDKPNMTVEDGPQGKHCVDSNDKRRTSDKSHACVGSIVPWILLGLVSIVMIVMCCYLRRVGLHALCQKHENKTVEDLKKIVKALTAANQKLNEENEKLRMDNRSSKEKTDETANRSGEQNHQAALTVNEIRTEVPDNGARQDEDSRAEDQKVTREVRMHRDSLKGTDSAEQVSAADRLCQMAKRDERTRQKIHDFPGVVEALEKLKDNSLGNLRHKVREALQMITVRTSASDDVSHIVNEVPTSASDDESHIVVVEEEEPNEEVRLMEYSPE